MKPSADKCDSCGKQHVPGFVFCQRCGAPLEANANGHALVTKVSQVVLDAASTVRLETAVVALLEDGKKSDALRLYREAMSTDAEHAADAIERLEGQMGFVPISGRPVPHGRMAPRHAVARIVARAGAAIRRRLYG